MSDSRTSLMSQVPTTMVSQLPQLMVLSKFAVGAPRNSKSRLSPPFPFSGQLYPHAEAKLPDCSTWRALLSTQVSDGWLRATNHFGNAASLATRRWLTTHLDDVPLRTAPFVHVQNSLRNFGPTAVQRSPVHGSFTLR